MIRRLLSKWFKPESGQASTAPDRTEKMKISYAALARFQGDPHPIKTAGAEKIVPPKIIKGVVPAAMENAVLAMDSQLAPIYEYANQAYRGLGFLGYPYLSELTQRPEYRKMAEIIAQEMTRKWIKLQSLGDDDKTEKLAVLEQSIKKYNLCTHFRKAAEQDGFFGRSQIYIDVATPLGIPARSDPEELKTILMRSSSKIAKGSLKGFKVIEPIWTTPYLYNSDDPLCPDFFKPTSWFVMGKQVHSSRLLQFVSREVPDMLKPSYNFGGLSLSQIAMPYIDNWIRTRDSVSNLIDAFSIPVLKTDMATLLMDDSGADLYKRLEFFNRVRNNRGTWAINNEVEDFALFNVPLSGLDKLQAQAQEQMASVCNIPLVKLLGITPSGLNASSDGEIRVFYDFIHAMQESVFSANLTRALEIIQLSEFGEIDPEITFAFEPLYQLDGESLANVRKANADAAAAFIASGVLSTQEERQRLASDPESGYAGLDVENVDGEIFQSEPLEDTDG